MEDMGDESGERAWTTGGIENTGLRPMEPFELHQSDNQHASEGSFPPILDLELKIGIKVATEEEAYELYNRYVINKGFSIRKGNKRVVNGILRQREFLCLKEGENNSNKDAPAQRNHLSTRTGCLARVRFTVKDSIWEITHFNDMHNHEFATQEEKLNLRSGRKVLDSHAAIMTSMYCVGIKPNQSFNYLARQVGGVNSVDFTRRDCYNFLQTISKFDPLDLKISCSCKLFEVLGLLCCHSLRVLFMNNIQSIPDWYILPRWTKYANERAIFSSLEPSNDQTSTRALRASQLNHIGHIIFNKASLTPQGTQIVKDKLKEALILVENELESITIKSIVKQYV